MNQVLGGVSGPELRCRWTGRGGRGPLERADVIPPVLMPDRWTANLLPPQNKNYKAVCLELKPEPTKVRSFFEAMPAARPETRGEVTWSQGSFAVPGGQDLSQVLGNTRERDKLSALTELHTSD